MLINLILQVISNSRALTTLKVAKQQRKTSFPQYPLAPYSL